VAASATTVTDIFGVGDVIAAMIIGFTGDVARFRSPDAYAAYNATAPVEVSSGGRRVHRLSRRGNRQLNHAVHMAAVTQICFGHSPGRAFYERKLAEGKTKKEALRALKRRLSDAIYRHLIADAQRTHRYGPGGTPRERLASLRGRHLTLIDRLFGAVTPERDHHTTTRDPHQGSNHARPPTVHIGP
jgi:transposase